MLEDNKIVHRKIKFVCTYVFISIFFQLLSWENARKTQGVLLPSLTPPYRTSKIVLKENFKIYV